MNPLSLPGNYAPPASGEEGEELCPLPSVPAGAVETEGMCRPCLAVRGVRAHPGAARSGCGAGQGCPCCPQHPGTRCSEAERGWAHPAVTRSGPCHLELSLVTLQGRSRGSQLIPNSVARCSCLGPSAPCIISPSLRSPCRDPLKHPVFPEQPLPPHLQFSPRHPTTSLPQSQDVFPVSYRNISVWYVPPFHTRIPVDFSCLSSCPGRAAPCLSNEVFLGFHLCKGVQWIGKAPQEC